MILSCFSLPQVGNQGVNKAKYAIKTVENCMDLILNLKKNKIWKLCYGRVKITEIYHLLLNDGQSINTIK